MTNPSEQTEREQAVRKLATKLYALSGSKMTEERFTYAIEQELTDALATAFKVGAERMRKAAMEIANECLRCGTETREAIRALEPERPASQNSGAGLPCVDCGK